MRKAIVSILRSAALLAVFSSSFACGSSSSTALGKYNEECTATDDCETGLMCLNRICTLTCNNSDSLCQAKDPQSTCVGGVCANRCVDTRNCPNGLTCVMMFAGDTCSAQ